MIGKRLRTLLGQYLFHGFPGVGAFGDWDYLNGTVVAYQQTYIGANILVEQDQRVVASPRGV